MVYVQCTACDVLDLTCSTLIALPRVADSSWNPRFNMSWPANWHADMPARSISWWQVGMTALAG
jgi:hypothetical protein